MLLNDTIERYIEIKTSPSLLLHGKKGTFIDNHPLLSVIFVMSTCFFVANYISQFLFSESSYTSISFLFMSSFIFVALYIFSKNFIIEKPYKDELLKKIHKEIPTFSSYSPYHIQKMISDFKNEDTPYNLSFYIQNEIKKNKKK